MRLGHATVEPAIESGVSESAVTPPQPTAASPGEPPGRS
jgi:hypothetical protein